MLSLWEREIQENMHLFKLSALALSVDIIYFINIQKIKVNKLVFRYIPHYLSDFIVNFHKLYIIM